MENTGGRRNTTLWIILGIVAVLLCICLCIAVVIGFFTFFPSSGYGY